MTEQTTRETRPLPVKWDGVPVEWSAWDSFPIFICPPPKLTPCRGCGLIVPASHAYGLRTERDGRKVEYIGGALVPVERHTRLNAFRCTACGYTEVLEGDKLWELDDFDYTQFGSVAR
jgi:hypothetical protein